MTGIRLPARLSAFTRVGVLGFFLQVAILALLTEAAGWPYRLALALAVGLTLCHNFAWHEWWTWGEHVPSRRAGRARRLLMFLATTGVVSLAGNLLLTTALVSLTDVAPVAANAATVGILSVANYVVADRWVFVRAPVTRQAVAATLAGAALATIPDSAAAAQPAAETLEAWTEYARHAEAKLERQWILKSEAATLRCPSEGADTVVHGTRTAVPGGEVHDWRACLLVPGAALDDVVSASKWPVRQAGVLEARVIEERGDSLRVFLKLVRHSLVTATYATEHDVRYRRHSPDLVTSRSVTTRIRELVDAGTPRERPATEDRGFLWRLNAYWRFAQVPSGVVVELESITLSRSVPALIRPMAAPVMDRIARESMRDTLEPLRNRIQGSDGSKARRSTGAKVRQ